MALAFDLRRPIVRRTSINLRSRLLRATEVGSVIFSFAFLFALVAGVF